MATAAFVASCTDSTETEQRAARAFDKAKSALTRGDHLEGRRLLTELVKLDEGTNKMVRHAEASLLLAENYSAGGEFETAEGFYRESMNLYTRLGDKAGARAAIIALATNAHTRGDDVAAYDLLGQSIRLAEALHEVEGVRELKRALIPVARAIGDIDLETKVLSGLVAEYHALNDDMSQAEVLLEMGNGDLSRGLFLSAQTRFQSARDILRRSGNSILMLRLLRQGGIVADKLNNQAEAIRLFAEGLRRTDGTAGSTSLRDEMLLRVGNLYLRQRKYGEAKRFMNAALRAAIKSQNKLVEAYALIQLSRCTSAPNEESHRALAAGAELIRSISLPWANTFALASLGDDASRSGRLNDALDFYRNAVATHDSSFARRNNLDMFADCEQTSYGGMKDYAYQLLIDLLCRVGKSEEAFVAAGEHERSEFRRQFGVARVRVRSNALDASFDALFRARSDYAGAENKLADALVFRSESRALLENVQRSLGRAGFRLHELADSIVFLNKQYIPLLLQGAPSSTEMQQLLPQGSAAVRYIPTLQSLYIQIVTGQGLVVEVAAIGRERLIALIQEYNDTLQKSVTDAAAKSRLNDLSSRLYQFLMRPITQHIPRSTLLHVMLPTDLPHVPLHALRAVGAHTPYAVEEYRFRYVSTYGLHESGAIQPRPPQSTVVFGNSGNTAWDVEYELRDVKAFVREARLYFDRDASLATLRMEQGDLLHCAMDIRFNSIQPDLSYIVLSGGRGYATAEYPRFGECFAIAPFPTVVLSNLSNRPLHADLISILHVNGTRDVVVNTVPATRKAKKLFNEVFYTFLMSGHTPAEAYQNALMHMLKDSECSAPGMWAPFALW